MANDLAAVQQNRGLISRMADKYGLDAGKFSATLRATVMPATHTDEEFAAFCIVANKYDLNPFLREIYAFPKKGGGVQAIVGVDGWMKLVNTHDQFDGVEFTEHLSNTGALESITCTMYRKDRSRPITAKEHLKECRRDTDPWRNWPYRMLRHKAYIQAARLAFGFGGIFDEDEAERMIEVMPDGRVSPDTVVGRIEAGKLKPVSDPPRRSSNDDNFATQGAQVGSAAAPSGDAGGKPVTPAPAQSAPPAAAAPAEPAKAKRGRPAKKPDEAAAPAAPAQPAAPAPAAPEAPAPAAPAAAPAAPPPPPPAEPTAEEEPPEPGSFEDEPDAADDLETAEPATAGPTVRTMKFIKAEVVKNAAGAVELVILRTEDGKQVETTNVDMAIKVAQLGMDKDPKTKQVTKSYNIDVLVADDNGRLILMGLAPNAVRK